MLKHQTHEQVISKIATLCVAYNIAPIGKKCGYKKNAIMKFFRKIF